MRARRIEDLPSFGNFLDAEVAKHRADAHKFVDSLFEKEGVDSSNNLWRRLLSAMMEDHARWQTRDKQLPFRPRMSIPLIDMTDEED